MPPGAICVLSLNDLKLKRALVLVVLCLLGPALAARDTTDPKDLQQWLSGDSEAAAETLDREIQAGLESTPLDSDKLRTWLHRRLLYGSLSRSRAEAWRDRVSGHPTLQRELDWIASGYGDTPPVTTTGFVRSWDVIGPLDAQGGAALESAVWREDFPDRVPTLEGARPVRRLSADAWGTMDLAGTHSIRRDVMARLIWDFDSAEGTIALTLDAPGAWCLMIDGTVITRQPGGRRPGFDQITWSIDLSAGHHQLQWLVADEQGQWSARLRVAGDVGDSAEPAPAPGRVLGHHRLKRPAREGLSRRLSRRWRGLPDDSGATARGLAETVVSHLDDGRVIENRDVLEGDDRRLKLSALLAAHPQARRCQRLLADHRRLRGAGPGVMRPFREALAGTREAWRLEGEAANGPRLLRWAATWTPPSVIDRADFDREWLLLEQAGAWKQLVRAFEWGVRRWGDESIWLRGAEVLPADQLNRVSSALDRHPSWHGLRRVLYQRARTLGRQAAMDELVAGALELNPWHDTWLLVAVENVLLSRPADARTMLEVACLARPGVAAWERLRRQLAGEEKQPLWIAEALAVTPDATAALVRVAERITVKDLGDGRYVSEERRVHHVVDGAVLGEHEDFWITELDLDHVEVLEARVISSTGEQAAPFESFAYALSEGEDPVRVTLIDWPELQAGDKLLIRVRVVRRRPSYFGSYFGWRHGFRGRWPLLSGRLDVLSPRLLTAGGVGVMPERLDSGWRVSVHDVPAAPDEAHAPTPEDLGPTVDLSSLTSWSDFAGWYSRLVGVQGRPDDALKERVRLLTTGLPDLASKRRAVTRFVNDDIQYVAWEFGVHGYKPHSVSQVLANGFGDCKDKSLLLQSMLAEIGVTSDLVLIRAEDRRGSEEWSVPLVDHFNHCILAVSEDTSWRFVDATARGHDWVLPPTMNRQTEGLLVRTGRLTSLPAGPQAADRFEMNDRLKIGGGGLARWQGELTLTGRYASPWHLWTPTDELRQRTFEGSVGTHWAPLQLTFMEWAGFDNRDVPLQSSLAGLVAPPISRDGATHQLSLPSHILMDPMVWVREHRTGLPRQLPLLVDGPWQWRWRSVIELPPSSQLTPAAHEVTTPFGSVTWRLTVAGTTATLVRALTVVGRPVPAEAAPAFMEFLNQMDECLHRPVEWTR